MRPCRWLIALLLIVLATALVARAHMLPAQTGTVHVVGHSVYVVVSVPVNALHNVPQTTGGAINAVGLGTAYHSIQQQFEQRFRIDDGHNEGQVVLTWLMMPQDSRDPANDRTSPYIVVMHRVDFPAPPRALWLSTDLFGTGAKEKTLTLAVSNEQQRQMLVLRAGKQRYRLLPGPWQLFANFLGTGILHILTGPDHLLFLLTLLVGGRNWRYWIRVITGFTIGHSITLSLAALGRVTVHPGIVEPGIAASIVVMALLNLFLPNSDRAPRTLLALLFGLLHGLGFASSLGEMGLDRAHRVLTLAGFNLGVEVGQLLFIAVIGTLGWLVLRLWRERAEQLPWALFASSAAAVLGTVMFVQRVIPQLHH
jgi:hydrogenase/urease accessory protein HupE